MNPIPFGKAKKALLRALALEGDSRLKFLEKIGASDPALRREVESLLAHEATPARLIEGGALGEGLGAEMASALGPIRAGPVPERIGPYTIRGVLGEGGMGIVYRAEQTEPVRREVALKVIRHGMDSERVVARFEAERRTLARMSHPAIAAVYDAGVDEAGRPYVAMELVRGEALTRFSDERRLTARERIGLVLGVCDALQHAHRKGIVHRDLKPSNLLVTESDGAPSVKVIDFGIAKALEGTSGGARQLTRDGQFIGTPEYMSPEQAGAVRGPIDARTDVFALGVVLYELLTGLRPREFADLPMFELLRLLREPEPEPPSRAVRRSSEIEPDAMERAAQARGCTPDMLEAQLGGDLDRILLQAMRSDPERRYPSAEALASDLRRYLAGEPVEARAAGDAAQSGPPPSSLPKQRTRLIGRAREIAECAQLLRRERLVSLIGAGGCGKTRLAIHTAEELLAELPGGVMFVDLAAVREPSRVSQAFASSLNLRLPPEQTTAEAIVSALAGSEALVILDNCEHVIEAASELATAILDGVEGIRILATSREPLNISGDAVFRLSTLDVPEEGESDPQVIGGADSVKLFLDRAHLARPRLEIRDAALLSVAEICRRLDGIPLALELAAARLRALSIDEIRAHLDDRFLLLRGRARAAPQRHQTLEATMAWSYDLLSEPERRLLCRVSVFAGGLTLAGAAAVTGPRSEESTLDLLCQLIDKSLVVADSGDGGTTRYTLLDTIRSFAQDRLGARGEEEEARNAHLAYFLNFASEAGLALIGSEQGVWLSRIGVEEQNVLTALDWGLRPGADGTDALNLVGSIWRFWWLRGHLGVGRRALERALGHERNASPALPRALALHGLGALDYFLGDMSASRAALEESLRIARLLGDKSMMSRALEGLGNVVYGEGDVKSAAEYYRQVLQLTREIGDARGVSAALNNLAEIERGRGNYEAARPLHEEARDIAKGLGAASETANQGTNLAMCQLMGNDIAAARSTIAECLEILAELGSRIVSADTLDAAAGIVRAMGRPDHSARWYGAAAGLRAATESQRDPFDQAMHQGIEATLRAELGGARYSDLWDEGRALTFEAAVSECLAWFRSEPLASPPTPS